MGSGASLLIDPTDQPDAVQEARNVLWCAGVRKPRLVVNGMARCGRSRAEEECSMNAPGVHGRGIPQVCRLEAQVPDLLR